MHSAGSFQTDSETAVETIAREEKKGLGLSGLSQSHPAIATPPAIDLRFMKLCG